MDRLLHGLGVTLRTNVVFTVPAQSSIFSRNIPSILASRDMLYLPWADAVRGDFDLVMSASMHGQLEELPGHIVISPHGPDYTKSYSLPSTELPLRRTTFLLAHESSRKHLPPGARIAVVGDPLFDSLSAVNDRTAYRRAVGAIQPHHKVLVLSSTWGESSLFAQRADHIPDLLGRLDLDRWIPAMILHPNIWDAHGEWQLRAWLREPLRMGLRLAPPESGWTTAVLASDMVIGDHGSVTAYASALGRPVMNAGADSPPEMVAGTVWSSFLGHTPRMRFDGSEIQQIERRLQSPDTAQRTQAIRNQLFAPMGPAVENIHRVLSSLVGVSDALGEPHVLKPPVDHIRATSVNTWRATIAESATQRPHVLRTPLAAVGEPDSRSHIGSSSAELNASIQASASVIVLQQHDPLEPATADYRSALRQYPGAAALLVETVHGRGHFVYAGGTRRCSWEGATATPEVAGSILFDYLASVDHEMFPSIITRTVAGLPVTVTVELPAQPPTSSGSH